MSLTVCLNANTLAYPTGGGHRWVYLNWALGLQSLGCKVIWMEGVLPSWGAPRIEELKNILREQIAPYGFGQSISLYSFFEDKLPAEMLGDCISLESAAAQSDLLLEIAYGSRAAVVKQFKRSALLDIDPGILQLWLSTKQIEIARHDVYFTIGETVGQPNSLIPDSGLQWNYLPPSVFLDAWPVRPPIAGAPFTTVSQWQSQDWIVHGTDSFSNQKRNGFEPYLDLPSKVSAKLELALGLGLPEDGEAERQRIISKGWSVRHADQATPTPTAYQEFIAASAGEFSCCKPSCVKLQNAWISDRTICYLATGRPAVVEYTGKSRYLPDAAGLFRFSDMDQAVSALETIQRDYEKQSRLSRQLVEEFFSAKVNAKKLLEIAMK